MNLQAEKHKNETSSSIPPSTRIGYVHLTVANLAQQIDFYQSVLSFSLHWRKENSAGLGAGAKDLLRLTEEPGAKRSRGTTGLYHFAVLFPNRRELARRIAGLFSIKYTNYPTDHIFTQTTYLDDPEGNGIELYADTPEEGTMVFSDGAFAARRKDGSWSNGREALNVEELFGELQPGDRLDQPAPSNTVIGHVHLHVANLDEAAAFYHEVLGFDIMGMATKFRAGFVSAGGYHHHIGFNTWAGEGALPPEEGAQGLKYFTVILPDENEIRRIVERINNAGIETQKVEEGLLVKDPSRNGVLLTTGDNY